MIDWDKELERKYHDVSYIFPLMQDVDYEELKSDIASNGLLEPIWLHPDGSIIDGRNRHKACIETETPPQFKTWSGEGSLVSFVVSLNLHRRHLTSSQRAACSLDALGMLEKEAEDRRRKGISETRTAIHEQIPEIIPVSKDEKTNNDSRDIAAQIFQTNPRYVSDAKKLQAEAPDLLEEVKSGAKNILQAKKEAAARKKDKAPAPLVAPATKSPRLIVGHAEKMMLDSGSIDLIITSPPYNLGSDSWPMGGDGRQPRENGIGYSDKKSEEEYQAWQVICLAEMYRVARPGASLLYNHKVRVSDGRAIHPVEWILKSDWILRQEIVWDRGSTHNHSSVLFWPEDERVYWLTKGKPTLPDRSIGMSTVWSFHGPVANTWHPAPFTDELPERCIKALGRPGIIVLDPFAGSCTTLRVALKYGYDAIGIDVSAEYLKTAQEENGWTNNLET